MHNFLVQPQQEQPLEAMLSAMVHNAALLVYSLRSTCPFQSHYSRWPEGNVSTL